MQKVFGLRDGVLPSGDERRQATSNFLRGAISTFLAELDALRELATTLPPHAAALDNTNALAKAVFDMSFEHLPEEKRRRAVPAIQKWLDATRPIAEPAAEQQKSVDRDKAADAALLGVVEAFDDPVAAHTFFTKFYGLPRHVPRTGLLRTLLVISAVSALEVLIGNVATAFYRLNNDALSAGAEKQKEKDFAFAELKTYRSIEEAVDALIARRVDALMRDGLDDWSAWFSRNLKLDFKSIAMDWPETVELFQRRHCFVHSGGRVTRRYIEATGSSRTRGEALDATEEYLGRATDLVTVIGALLAVGAATKLLPEDCDTFTGDLSSKVFFGLMVPGHWMAVRGICGKAVGLCATERSAHVFKVNGWLAQKRVAGNVDVIRPDVAAWDTSALDSELKLVKLALLNDVDRALPLMKTILERGELSLTAVQMWPVFAELRADPRFGEYVPLLSTAPGPRDAEVPWAG